MISFMERIGENNGPEAPHEEPQRLRIPRVGIRGVLHEYARHEVELHDQRFAMVRAEIAATGDSVEFGGLLRRIHVLSSIPVAIVVSRQRLQMAEIVDQLVQQVGLHNVETLYNVWSIRQEKRRKSLPRK
jgi:hypothetical protein